MLNMKFKISRNNLSSNIVFNLDNKISPIGTQKDVDDFIEYETNIAINTPTSNEIVRFIPNSGMTTQYWFYFIDNVGVYDTTILNQDITASEANGDIGKNSFYLLEFFDNYDSRKQTKVFQTYLVGLKYSVSTIYDVNTTTNSELLNWYIPEINLNNLLTITGNTLSGSTIYCKFSFYNSKNGLFTYFLNPNIINDSEIRNYFIGSLDMNNKTYQLNDIDNITEIINSDFYIEKQRSNIITTPIYKPNYPTGNTTIITGNTITYVTN